MEMSCSESLDNMENEKFRLALKIYLKDKLTQEIINFSFRFLLRRACPQAFTTQAKMVLLRYEIKD